MKEVTAVVIIVFLILLAVTTMVLGDMNYKQQQAKAGLQECVVRTTLGNTITVWQKECK